jgi:hypothetical protein
MIFLGLGAHWWSLETTPQDPAPYGRRRSQRQYQQQHAAWWPCLLAMRQSLAVYTLVAMRASSAASKLSKGKIKIKRYRSRRVASTDETRGLHLTRPT